MKRITINLDDDVAKKLKLASAMEGKFMKDYLTSLIVKSVGTISVTRKPIASGEGE